MYLTLYFLTNRLPNSLRTVRDRLLSLYPTELTLASFETLLRRLVLRLLLEGGATLGVGVRGCGAVEVVEVAIAVGVAGVVEVAVTVGVPEVVEAVRVPGVEDRAWMAVEVERTRVEAQVRWPR
ncbi:unnamed protein product [Closterium sp. NIES-54]